jgi:hypothetical protein
MKGPSCPKLSRVLLQQIPILSSHKRCAVQGIRLPGDDDDDSKDDAEEAEYGEHLDDPMTWDLRDVLPSEEEQGSYDPRVFQVGGVVSYLICFRFFFLLRGNGNPTQFCFWHYFRVSFVSNSYHNTKTTAPLLEYAAAVDAQNARLALEERLRQRGRPCLTHATSFA